MDRDRRYLDTFDAPTTHPMVHVRRGARRYEFMNATVWDCADPACPAMDYFIGNPAGCVLVRDDRGRMMFTDRKDLIT